jgi:hypothetical protein
MTIAEFSLGFPRKITGEAALTAATRLWLLVAVIGQWAFLYYIVAFYGASTAQGHIQTWARNTALFKGYVAGDAVGNLAFGVHVLLAAIIAFGGVVQLIPWIRARVPALHRWNGRIFLLTSVTVSIIGLWLVWVRGGNPSIIGAIAISLNAELILIFAALASRTAQARDFTSHRRWALRAYIAANGVWFERVGFMAWMIITHGFAPGRFFSVWMFACYLLPLGVLELYLRTRDRARPGGFWAMAAGLFTLTVPMAVGIFGLYALMWRPLLTGA